MVQLPAMRVPVEMRDALRKIARDETRQVVDVVRIALRQWLEQRRKREAA